MVLRVRNSISGFRSPVDSTVRPFDCSQGKRGGRKADRDALAAASALQFMLPQASGQRVRVLRIFFQGMRVSCIICVISIDWTPWKVRWFEDKDGK